MDTYVILIIISVVAFLVLLLHGLWASHREKSQLFKNHQAFTQDATQRSRLKREPQKDAFEQPTQSYEATKDLEPKSQQNEYENSFAEPVEQDQELTKQTETTPKVQAEQTKETAQPTEKHSQQKINSKKTMSTNNHDDQKSVEEAVNQIKITIPGNTTPPKRQLKEEEPSNEKTEELTVDETQHVEDDHQNNITIEESPINNDETQPATTEKPKSDQPKTLAPVILYVVAEEGRDFNGAHLVQHLENLGLLSGHDNFFHYHFDMNSKSPSIFTVANMEKPGTFPINALAHFRTAGVAFFMQRPSAQGRDEVNFKLMLSRAETLAHQLNGFLLDDNQDIFDDKAKQKYLARVSTNT